MIYKLNKKGETLIEVITALTSLVLAGVAAVTVIISMMQSNAISKEYLIAQNLAREGIEGVITIRNTNWLRFPSTKSTDWLCVNVDNDNSCDQTIYQGNYILDRNVNNLGEGFTLARVELDLDLSNGLDSQFQLTKKQGGDVELYSHWTDSTDQSPVFYRMITFEQIGTTNDKYKVTAKIQWKNGSKINEYKLSSIITNYAK